MRHSRTPYHRATSPSNTHLSGFTLQQHSSKRQNPSKRHFIYVEAHLSSLMQHCSLSGNIRHLNQLRYQAPTNIQAISVHVTFCPGKLSQQHHIHPSDRHPGDINPCNIFNQAALEWVSSRWKLRTCGKTHLPNPNPSSHQSNATVRVL